MRYKVIYNPEAIVSISIVDKMYYGELSYKPYIKNRYKEDQKEGYYVNDRYRGLTIEEIKSYYLLIDLALYSKPYVRAYFVNGDYFQQDFLSLEEANIYAESISKNISNPIIRDTE